MHKSDSAVARILCVDFLGSWVPRDCVRTDLCACGHRHVCLSRNRAEPQYPIFDQFVLNGTREYLVAMPHVHIQHSIFRVCPNDGQVTAREDILKPNWIIGRIESDQYSNVFI